MAVAVGMHAAVLAEAGAVRYVREPRPEPGPGQQLVRVEGCGVCGSNVPVWEGRPWFEYPLPPGAPGHEGWGVVEETGERVCFLSEQAFAEYVVVEEEALVPLPPELEGQPVPGEALGCAVNVFRRSRVRVGDTVAVVGVGFLGALLVQLAARAGADVVAIARRPRAQALARELGARVAAEEWHGDADCVIEAGGVQATLDIAARLVRPEGRLVIAGYHQDGPRSIDLQSWNWRGIDVVNAHERDPRAYVEGMRLAVEAVAAGELDPAPLYTHSFPLDQLGLALEAARTRPDGFVKALVYT
jgi:threonine dehydrogenase-like Zn-dependent dehydrogenase